ncbi:hypothetical protein FQA47_006577 [Oryzias melastigma]|uniref:Uncharacterized protein n=1 Tax=Oryzias melastigma TaxID=30732 RepID=A0A834BZ97_ORYME|nr:hypothetical protein FQA47_006577 [Oryzias melastigma]
MCREGVVSGPLTLYAPTLAVGLTAVLRAAKAAVCGVKRFLSRDDAKSILVLRVPHLKTGQAESNINHFAVCSFLSAIVIEQTNGKRPVAGVDFKSSSEFVRSQLG